MQIPFDFNHWTYGVEIKQLKKDLESLDKLGVTHVDIVAEENWGGASVFIQAYLERLETKEEFKERVDRQKRYDEDQKRKELDQLEKLKAKYENNK